MGMAASQARLLCITARIHDVEYQAQAIQAAKVQLATQSDQVYQEYLDALDATTLTVNMIDTQTGATSLVAATFNNLCSRNRVTAADSSNYAIRNAECLLVVEDDIEDAYYKFKEAGNNDAYEFAVYMMNGGNLQHFENSDIDKMRDPLVTAEEAVYQSLSDSDKSSRLITLHDKLTEITGDSDIYAVQNRDLSDDEYKEYQETLAAYRKELYKRNSADIYAQFNRYEESFTEDFNNKDFNYYVDIFNQIKSCGGCVSINDYNGPDGDAANNSGWLQSMVQSGQFSIEIVKTDSSTGEVSMDRTSPSSDSCLSYTTTSTIDNRAVAKAEAEYEHKLKQIDKKDEQFDLDLSKLESERTALTTEYDSVKKVIEDNIDRTFGIFS